MCCVDVRTRKLCCDPDPKPWLESSHWIPHNPKKLKHDDMEAEMTMGMFYVKTDPEVV